MFLLTKQCLAFESREWGLGQADITLNNLMRKLSLQIKFSRWLALLFKFCVAFYIWEKELWET